MKSFHVDKLNGSVFHPYSHNEQEWSTSIYFATLSFTGYIISKVLKITYFFLSGMKYL